MTKRVDVPGLDERPLHALLSAALVAFTFEVDDEVELRHTDRGDNGSRFSLVAWLNIVQYLAEGPASVADICAQTHMTTSDVGPAAGCLERWGFLTVVLKPGGSPRATSREGFGSARGVNAKTVLGVTAKGDAAIAFWPEAIAKVESRWEQRHGSALSAALNAGSTLATSPGVLMPEGLPSGWMKGGWRQCPAGKLVEPRAARLPVLLGRALLAVTMAYEQRSPIALALASNVLRVIDDAGTPVAEVSTRSGISSQTAGVECTAITKYFGFADVVKEPNGRRKLLRLTDAGREAQRAHVHTVEVVDEALGPPAAKTSRAMRTLLAASDDGDLAIRAALTPPPGVRRSGVSPPALGRADTASAAIARNRELVTQAATFLADPFGTLPHYPVWDGNRGFGP